MTRRWRRDHINLIRLATTLEIQLQVLEKLYSKLFHGVIDSLLEPISSLRAYPNHRFRSGRSHDVLKTLNFILELAKQTRSGFGELVRHLYESSLVVVDDLAPEYGNLIHRSFEVSLRNSHESSQAGVLPYNVWHEAYCAFF